MLTINANKEDLLNNHGWKATNYDYTSGDLDYKGMNTKVVALDSDPNWRIWKYTWGGGNMTKLQGPLVGTWTGRGSLGW